MEVDYLAMALVHRLLRQKTDLTDRIARGPRQIRIVAAAETKFMEEVDAAKLKIRETKMAADQKQLQLGSREAKIADLQSRLNACDSNKEYQLLKDAIAADEQASAVLSDEILEMLERLDELEVELGGKNDQLEKAKLETAAVTKRVNEEGTRLKSELAEIVGELKDTEKNRLRGDLGKEYRRIVEAHGEDTFAKSDGKTCGNCCHTFTAQTLNDLLAKKLVICKGCGALMYNADGMRANLEA